MASRAPHPVKEKYVLERLSNFSSDKFPEDESFWNFDNNKEEGKFDPEKYPEDGPFWDLDSQKGEVESCYHISTSDSPKRRKAAYSPIPDFTKFEVGMSPVRHIVNYLRECQSLPASWEVRVQYFRYSLGETAIP